MTYSIPLNPTWDSWVQTATADGRVVSKSGSVWLYRRVPMAPVKSAKTTQAAIDAGAALATCLEELAGSATGRNRQMAKSNYREFHLLWVNVPVWFEADPSLPTATMLNRSFRDRTVPRKELILGVKLRPSANRGTFIDSVHSVIETFTAGQRPLSDFDQDYERIASVMASAGFDAIDPETLRFMQSWWTHGNPRQVPVLAHEEHMHYFTSLASAQLVRREFDLADCHEWNTQVSNQFPITYANLQSLDVDGGHIGTSVAQWAAAIAERGARVISVRGLLEPAKITRAELRRHASHLASDSRQIQNAGNDERVEIDEHQSLAKAYEKAAGLGSLPATIVDASVIMGFDGVHDEVERLAPPTIRITPMTNVQGAAWHETMIASSVRANPVLHDLSVDAIAHVGLQDLTILGDKTGALVGFTSDGQPVYMTYKASVDQDAAPLIALFAKTGAGKTLLAQWIAYQMSFFVPVAFIDPKPGSDLRGMVESAGGRAVSMDDFFDSDGALDALINFPAEQAIPLATSVLGTVTSRFANIYKTMETEVASALQYAVAQGARATGQALIIARDAGKINSDFVDDILQAIAVEPRFRAVVGLDPDTPSLRIDKGLTLFMAGDRHLDLPSRSTDLSIAEEPMAVRSTVTLLRMLLRCTMYALRGTGGITFADEAHVLERAAKDELEDAGRLARQWEEQLVLMTQTPTGPVKLNLSGHFAAGFTGHLSAEDEAMAALNLFQVEDASIPMLKRMITAPADLGGGQGYNWNTLLPLWDHSSGKRRLVRPARFMYRDLHSNLAPVEVHIPEWFFRFASTNPEDRRAWFASQQQLVDEKVEHGAAA